MWPVVKEGAGGRLGKPLLLAYVALAVVGIIVVEASVVVMHYS